MPRRSTGLLTLLVVLVAAPAARAGIFAPYADVTLGSDPQLAQAASGTGAKVLNLGFVVARGRACAPSWGGLRPVGDPTILREAGEVRAAGADVQPSFGGAAGSELSTVCRSVHALAAEYTKALTTLHATRADFDVEGAAVGNHAAGVRLAKALARVERARRHLRVTFTLPVDPAQGLTADDLRLLRDLRAAHARADVVNVMTMDYGDDVAPPAADTMAGYALKAAARAVAQLGTLWPRSGGWYPSLGITPMLGVNDVTSEVFTLDDASALVSAARTRGVAQLGVWSVARDAPCADPGAGQPQDDCSGVPQSPFAFSAVLRGIAG